MPNNPSAFVQLKPLLALLLTLVLTAYQLWRIIAFVEVYGGVEHDGGWTLGAARSLAERGEYTYMVSTIVDPTVSSDINVDQKFDIQTSDGRIWFRTSASIGPASVLPDALVLRIFGFSFWALRAGPLLFYTLFLLLAAYILYQLAGLGAILLFHAFIFFYPHLSIFLGYEALGEMPSMFYQLGAFLLFATALKRQNQRLWHFWGVGLLAGLAINAKLLALLSISGIIGWAGLLWLLGRKVRLRELLSLGGGIILIEAAWELTQLIILTRLTNFDSYLRQAQQRWIGFLDEGSGLRLRTQTGLDFMWRKFLALKEITQPQAEVIILVALGLILGTLILLWLWRDEWRRNLLGPLGLGWLANTIWFVGLAKTGWARHYWFGLVLGVMLLSVIPVVLVQAQGSPLARQQLKQPVRLASTGLGLLLLLLLGWGFVSQPYVRSFFLPDQIVAYWEQKRVDNNYQATLPSLIVPRKFQTEIIDYINHMPPEAHVYYPFAHKAAEFPVQTGRINYPLDRRARPGLPAHPADILLFQPFLVSPWTHDPTMRQDLLNQVAQVCPQPIIKNDYYIVCLVEQLRPRQ